MKKLETKRLVLRPFTPDDWEAVHRYASSEENTVFMPFGPNSEEQTKAFISRSIAYLEADPCTQFEFAVVSKESGQLIGACGMHMKNAAAADVGWILHRDYWKQGFGSEMAAELLRFGFEDLGLHRIAARCDADNYGSYRVMERNGMRREGCYIKSRPPKNPATESWHDEYTYAILADEWQVKSLKGECNVSSFSAL